jgi:DNA-binding CsgD family transcriptional regulator
VGRGGSEEIGVNEEIVRLLALQLRLQLESQAEAIVMLSRAGFSNSRIGRLLGTTTDVAKVTVARSTSVRKRSGTPARARSTTAGERS